MQRHQLQFIKLWKFAIMMVTFDKVVRRPRQLTGTNFPISLSAWNLFLLVVVSKCSLTRQIALDTPAVLLLLTFDRGTSSGHSVAGVSPTSHDPAVNRSHMLCKTGAGEHRLFLFFIRIIEHSLVPCPRSELYASLLSESFEVQPCTATALEIRTIESS